MAKEPAPLISEGYMGHLSEIYDPALVKELCDHREVAISHRNGAVMAYSRINEGASVPALYIPGFTEGITAKAPFALELATDSVHPGIDVILPDQHRKGIDSNGQTKRGRAKKDATHSQALNYLAVLDAEVPSDEQVDIITHSYGSLIFQAMTRIAPERFRDTRAILLAPAGANAHETLPQLGWRFMLSMLSESRSLKDIQEHSKEMMKAGSRHLLSNPLRSWREIMDLSNDRLDYRQLMALGLGDLVIAAYGQDDLFSYRQIDSTMQEALEAGATYLTPVRIRPGISPVEGATHNDEQFNPSRVANAVKELLSYKEALI